MNHNKLITVLLLFWMIMALYKLYGRIILVEEGFDQTEMYDAYLKSIGEYVEDEDLQI